MKETVDTSASLLLVLFAAIDPTVLSLAAVDVPLGCGSLLVIGLSVRQLASADKIS